MVQRLGLCAFTAKEKHNPLCSIPGGELRSCKPRGAAETCFFNKIGTHTQKDLDARWSWMKAVPTPVASVCACKGRERRQGTVEAAWRWRRARAAQPQAERAPYTLQTHGEACPPDSPTGERPRQDPTFCPLIRSLDFWPPELEDNKFLLFHDAKLVKTGRDSSRNPHRTAAPTPAPSGLGRTRSSAGGAGRAAAPRLLSVSGAPSWPQGGRAPPPAQTLTVSRETAERRGSQHLKQKLVSREVPGGPVVRIWRLGRRGLGSAPRRGPEIPQAARRDPKNF